MPEYICCRSCSSPSCKGCNIYTLSKMLDNGKLDSLMNDNRSINPTADVAEVKRGRWYLVEYEYFTCSECGNSYYTGCESTAKAKERLKSGGYYEYCPNCGADMRGEDD